MVVMKAKINPVAAPTRIGRLALLAAAILSCVGPALAQKTLPAEGRDLTAAELLPLVEERSWQWDDGAGRFLADRRFVAFTRGKDGPTYGEGRYRLDNDGRLCLMVKWRNEAGESDAGTCFLHRKVDGVIYQHREGSGDWYPFMHTPLLETDEYAKFTKKDLVSEQFAKVKAELEAKAANRKGNGK